MTPREYAGASPPSAKRSSLRWKPNQLLDVHKGVRELTEKKTNSHSARLYYLVQYTSGEVQELVKSCLSMKEEIDYQKAR